MAPWADPGWPGRDVGGAESEVASVASSALAWVMVVEDVASQQTAGAASRRQCQSLLVVMGNSHPRCYCSSKSIND